MKTWLPHASGSGRARSAIGVGAGLRLLALVGALFASVPFAFAQSVVATVNGAPITSFDVEQRIRIAALTERRRIDSRAALQELIDDQVKLIEARRVGYRITEAGVDTEFERLAKGNRQTSSEFSDNLRRAGIEPNAIRAKIRADLGFQVLQREQARKGTQISNEELEKAVAEAERKQKEIIDYRLQSVIFVVPSGASPADRLRAANAARNQFASCEEGAEELRQLRDVAVRPPVSRSSDTLSEQLASVLAKTPVGRLTPAFVSDQGVEMVAVCERNVRGASSSVRAEVAAQMAEKQAQASMRAYIESLRSRADIRFKR